MDYAFKFHCPGEKTAVPSRSLCSIPAIYCSSNPLAQSKDLNVHAPESIDRDKLYRVASGESHAPNEKKSPPGKLAIFCPPDLRFVNQLSLEAW